MRLKGFALQKEDVDENRFILLEQVKHLP